MTTGESTAGGEGAREDARPLVEARGIFKRFGGVQALDDVSLEIQAGSIHGLVGENGAGKSTLAKIVGGVYRPDAGELLVDGRHVSFHAPRDALDAGIATIAQEIALVPARTVLENVMLGIESSTAGVLRSRELRRRFDELNRRTGFGLDPLAVVRTLRTAEQQKVEILRAIARDARLLLMDEPTAALTRDETERLLDTVRSLAAGGTAVILVSHYLQEVLTVCETVTSMRNGRLIRTSPSAEETPETLVSAMIGRELSLEFPPKEPPFPDAPVVLEARGLTRGRELQNVSLTIRAGEIVGLAGLVGSGRTEVARAIFGADRLDAGEILFEGRPVSIKGPRQASRLGIAMLPESRKEQGLFMIRPVRENISIVDVRAVSRLGVVDRRAEGRRTRELAHDLDVRTSSQEAMVRTLSGGNQQKVLFAKWLFRRPKLLIADEPTRGVDVGAKRQIHELLLGLARDGMGVLLISSEIEEVLGLAHRVLVMRAGRVVGEFEGDAATDAAVMTAAFTDGPEIAA
ncbi:MAG TPA: sugar ABC transporter ATP-binding protein [Gaiellaceae bacterium]|nr:sugar ABC transporter ATP-binding protein [Gaiellaceae bacterium]